MYCVIITIYAEIFGRAADAMRSSVTVPHVLTELSTQAISRTLFLTIYATAILYAEVVNTAFDPVNGSVPACK